MGALAAVPSIRQRSAVSAQMLDLICFLDAHPIGDHLAPFLVICPCAWRSVGGSGRTGGDANASPRCADQSLRAGEGPGTGKGARTASPWTPCLLVPKLQAAAVAAGVRGQAHSASATPTPSGLDLAFWQLFLALQLRGKGGFLTLPCLLALCPLPVPPAPHSPAGSFQAEEGPGGSGPAASRSRGTGLAEPAGGPERWWRQGQSCLDMALTSAFAWARSLTLARPFPPRSK